MKHLVILSGKGGTGKTSITASFAHIAHTDSIRAVLADADVDAANLELVLSPQVLEEHDFIGGKVAWIDSQKCEGCGLCKQVCRFDAIEIRQEKYLVDPIACDGCAACLHQCPTNAIRMEPQLAGHWFRSQSHFGPLFHAALRPAQENSGKLVTLVKQQARLLAMDEKYPLILVDGPPGIGCPVIAAAAGADLALVVTEPTIAGVHDLKRILQTTTHFRIPALVVINKADIYPEGSAQIEAVCGELGVELIGQVPFDPSVTEAMLKGEPVTAYRAESPSSQALAAIWKIISARLFPSGGSNA